MKDTRYNVNHILDIQINIKYFLTNYFLRDTLN